MAIEVVNRQRLARVERQGVAELARATLQALRQVGGRDFEGTDPAGASLTIAFVRDARMRQLNRDFRGKDRATDVLSFSAGRAGDESGEARDAAFDNYLGDIVISTDTAMRQAQDAQLTFEREVQELVIHGVLHLCGYDHETNGGEMNRLERKLRKRLLD